MLSYLKKYRLFLILTPLFMVGEVVMDLWQPRLMSVIVNDGVLGLNHGGVGDMDLVIRTGLKMTGNRFPDCRCPCFSKKKGHGHGKRMRASYDYYLWKIWKIKR